MNINRKNCFRIGIGIFILYLCIHYWDAFVHLLSVAYHAAWPLFLGAIMAYVVNILMTFLEKKLPFSKSRRFSSWKRPICMILSYVLIVLLFNLIVFLVLPELAAAINMLIQQIPIALSNLAENKLMSKFLPDVTAYLEGINWENQISQIINLVKNHMGSIANGMVTAVSSLFGYAVNFLLALIFSIYILLGKEKLGSQIQRVARRYLSEKIRKKLLYVINALDYNFHAFIVGQCTEAVIIGILCIVGMLLFRFPYAVMIGVLVGATALIPIVGACIGAAVGTFMILAVSPFQAVMFLIFFVVLQQLEGNLIYPKVVGSSMGLPAIWVLAAVTVGAGLGGIAGILLGVPLFATFYGLLKEDVAKNEAKKS